MKFGKLNKCAAKICKRFPPHLNNVYTLPCETWNPHHAGASTVMSDNETPEFIPSQLWPPNSPDLNPVDYSMREYHKRRCTKHASLIWMNWNSDWKWSGPSWITSSLQQPNVVNGVVDSCRSVMHVLYTSLEIFPTHCYQLESIWWIWRPQLRWDKFWSFSNNSIIARVWWAFPVSQGSVETLFTWGEKRSYDFCGKFIQETMYQISSQLPKFYRRYYKTHFGLFLSGHSV